MLKDYVCTGPGETFAAGARLATFLKEGDVIGLVGNLGAGKTLFVQGLAQGLSVPDSVAVTSPTFSLVNEYRGGRLSLVHIDLYRIEEAAELEHLGLEELIDLAGVSAVEWCERFPVLPEDHLLINIEIPDIKTPGVDHRVLQVRGTGPRSRALADEWGNDLRLKTTS
ncbi:MAG: tRNA (adenosine(37)-N6)-threonylcarbamoyltransferase complex ATPase subunit type 1 TsaE [Kofleriaceae bacterium]|nr:tRNA (adenosine(37)-N6)-threonylcarbamoyltransferase complex ATPase subunit type 1 TsaE [Kofleriaceae bacterium]